MLFISSRELLWLYEILLLILATPYRYEHHVEYSEAYGGVAAHIPFSLSEAAYDELARIPLHSGDWLRQFWSKAQEAAEDQQMAAKYRRIALGRDAQCDANLEAKLRRILKRDGYRLVKSRSRTPEAINYGTYTVVDEQNVSVAGERMSLGDCDRLDAQYDRLTIPTARTQRRRPVAAFFV